MSDLLPAKLQPRSLEPIPVAIEDVPDEVVTDEQAEAALQRLAFVPIAKDTVKDLRQVGVHLKGQGVLKVARGRVMVNQAVLAATIGVLANQITKVNPNQAVGKDVTNKLHKLGTTLASLVKVSNDSQELLLEIEKLGAPPGKPMEVEAAPNQAFIPGAPVKPAAGGTLVIAKTAHLHGVPPPKSAK